MSHKRNNPKLTFAMLPGEGLYGTLPASFKNEIYAALPLRCVTIPIFF